MIYVFLILAAVAAQEVTTLPLETRKNVIQEGETARSRADQLGVSLGVKATQHAADLWRLVIAAEHGIAGHTVVASSIIVKDGLDVLIDMTADIPGVRGVVRSVVTSTQDRIKMIEIDTLEALAAAKEQADVILHKSNKAVQRALENLTNKISSIFGGGR